MKYSFSFNKNFGRPTKYSDEIVNIAREYLISCEENNETPFIEELALKIGVDDSTLWNWSGKYEEFAQIYNALLTYQKLDLKKKSLKGDYASRIASLLLSSDHNVNLKRKTEIEAKVVDEKISNLDPEQRKFLSDAITKAYEHIYSQPS